MSEFTDSFTVDDDQHILMKMGVGKFYDDQISTRICPEIISTLDTRVHSPHMLYLRSIYLIDKPSIWIKCKKRFIKEN